MRNSYTESYMKAEQQEKSNFRNIWVVYSYHWPLFVLSILICISVAVVYIKSIIPIYQVRAVISMKDSKKSPSEAKAALEELDILQTPKVIENEVAIIKSRPLMRKVVQDLDLWINYQVPYAYSYKDLYTESPVKLKLIKQLKTLKKQEYTIIIQSADHFILQHKNGKQLTLPFNKAIIFDNGVWEFRPTKEINNYIDKPLKIQVQNPESTVSMYQMMVNVTLDRNAPIISLQTDDEVPERGVQVLNHLIATYKAINIEDKNRETERTLKFIDDRLTSLTGELTSAEKNVEDYKSSIGLTDISSQSKLYLDNVQSNDVRLSDVDIQLNIIKGIEAYLNSPNSASVPATIGISDPGLVSLVDQLTKLQIQHSRLLVTTPEDHPIFAPINNQIASTKLAIANKVNGIKLSLTRTRNQIKSYGSRFETSIKSIPGQERHYISIKRQQGIKENLYVYLLQKREEVALSYASTLTDARTVEEAYFEEPQSSKKYPLAISVFLGFLIPAGLIYGRNTLSNRVQTRQEIEMATSAPIICELVQSIDNKSIVVLNRQSVAIGEQLRTLRTNLLQVSNERIKGRVTLFTSSVAGEGKSFIASNIGVSLAASGLKTVILELDLRKPRIAKIFNLDNNRPGLSNLLNREVTKEEVIQPSGIHPNLFVMRSGPIPDNPSELLESHDMESLINELRYEYDNIIIDSPPLRLVTEALILAPLCDVCLYVLRQNFTLKSELAFIEKVYRSAKLKNMNLVFNGVSMDSRYGYSRDYVYYAESKTPSKWYSVFSNFLSRF